MNKYQLPNGTYQFQEEHLEDVAQLLAATFLQQNEIWRSAQLPRNVIHQFFRKEIRLHFISQNRLREKYQNPNIVVNHVQFPFIQISVANEMLVGVAMHLEIEEYRFISSSEKESEVELFRQLEKEGKELIKAIDINALEPGKYVYATWGAHIKVPGASPMDKIYEASLSYDHMRSQGILGMVFRSSSERLVRMHTNMGAELLHQLPFNQGGKDFRIWLLRQNFDNPMLSQIIEQAKSNLNQGYRARL